MTIERTRTPTLNAVDHPGRKTKGFLRRATSVFAASRSCLKMVCSGLSRSAALLLMLIVLSPVPLTARVLSDEDLDRISVIKASFQEVATEIAQSLRQPDLSRGDSECIQSILQELVQISDELISYEYLITIESKINDYGDDDAMRGLLRFAIDKAISILETQRRRLDEIRGRCSQFALAEAKTQRAAQLFDGTTAILKSIRPRL